MARIMINTSVREIIEWLCPVCGSDDVLFYESKSEDPRRGMWHCIICNSWIPTDVMFTVNYMRRKIKRNVAKKTRRESKKVIK